MENENEKLRAWILWAHDPCPEGGWHIRGSYDTQDEAIREAKTLHAREVRIYMDTLNDPDRDPDRERPAWGFFCYDACMVTGGEVFSLDGPVI